MPEHTHRPVTLMWEAHAKPGLDAGMQAFMAGIASAPLDGGTVEVYEINGQPAAFVVIEHWADQAALDQHMKSARMQTLMPQLAELMDGSAEHAFKSLELVDPAA
jgi:quinol monooxygenase YgiN